MLRTFQRFKGLADDMLSGLCQYLDRHVIRNQILLDQRAKKLILRLGSCREAHLDLLEIRLSTSSLKNSTFCSRVIGTTSA